MLCDGDSKAFDAVTELKVYGEDVAITKEDCINHVSKRMGTALRKSVAENKAKETSISEKGKPSKEKIARIQNFYGKAKKECSSDVKVLKTRIMAILLNLSTTDKNPKHVHCPPGPSSW